MDFRWSTHRRANTGFSLVELVLALSIVLVATGIFHRMLSTSERLRTAQRENAIASDAARVVLERMRHEDFADVYRLYNVSPDDDPDGYGSAPGNRFEVSLLRAVSSAPDGLEGEIVFPTAKPSSDMPGADLVLREDVVDHELGMPRDLNGDNVIDEEDRKNDYILLPVRIVVRWQGVFGERSFALQTMLTDFEVRG